MSVSHWEVIHGWFDFKNIYDDILNKAKDGDVIVEIGTWFGKSTCYMGRQIRDLKKKVSFYACDKFETPPMSPFNEICHRQNFYEIFMYNLRMQGVENEVLPVVGDSLKICDQFPLQSISFIFIDDDHDPQFVYRELYAWYPKMKPNSIMYGHDYTGLKEILNQFAQEHNLTWTFNGNTWIMPLGGTK